MPAGGGVEAAAEGEGLLPPPLDTPAAFGVSIPLLGKAASRSGNNCVRFIIVYFSYCYCGTTPCVSSPIRTR
jgi:hypothetical protein